MIPEIKKRVKNFNNPIFQRYLKGKMRVSHKCPICDLATEDYKALKGHIDTKHPTEIQNEAVIRALDPLYKVREHYAMRDEPEYVSIGKFFGEKITSKHNQHVLLNLIGKTGMGKSNAAMRIGEEVARYIANVKGGDPSQYFNINNIAIMRLDSIIPIIEDLDQKQYNVVILDDIGASYSARDFNKTINKNVNKIFQTFRDTNTMLILTMPDTFLIDKVARKLAHYQIEIFESRHDEGISVGKLFEVIEQYRRGGQPHYHFVVYNGIKYPKIIFKRASDLLVNEYEKKRSGIRKVMMADSITAIRAADSEALDGIEKKEKIPKHVMLADKVRSKVMGTPGISDRALSEELQTSRETIKKTRTYLKDSGLL